jgi:hypothetical protein
MAKFVFTVGRPGSGKSSIGRAISAAYGGERHVVKLNDYPLLWEMFMQEEQGQVAGRRQFRRAEKNGSVGFEVLDRQVFPLALCLLDELAGRYLAQPKLVVIEFSRSDYTDIFRYFRPYIMKNAHIFLLQTSLETCIQRIARRVERPCCADDRLVAEETVRKYHQDDGSESLLTICQPGQVSIINNDGHPRDTWLEVKGRLDALLYQVPRPALWSSSDLERPRAPFKDQSRVTLLA